VNIAGGRLPARKANGADTLQVLLDALTGAAWE
jgi:hypothetical protein